MHHSKKVRFRVLLSLVFTLIFSAILAAQTETGSPSKNSSANPVKQRLEQILVHFGQTPPTGVEAQPQPVPARLDPRSAEAHQSSPLQEVRLSGAPTAAERYVFGRMDLATGNYPNGVAAGAFQTGGPQSIAVANDYSETVSIYVANADGTFQPRVDYATGVEPGAIAVADFNGDHNLDLAVANWAAPYRFSWAMATARFSPTSIIP